MSIGRIGSSPYRATYALITINVVVYVVMLLAGPLDEDGSFTRERLIQFGGIYPPLVRAGEWWRLLSAAFVHASAPHLIWNMLSFAFLGRWLEPRYAQLRYLALYLLGALGSSFATLAWFWNTDLVAIGASGAICALIGAGAASAFRMGIRGTEFRNSMLAWAAVVLINGVTNHANNVAHASGLILGALLVLAFGRRGAAALRPREQAADALGGEDVVTCSACGAGNPPVSAYCGRCGAALRKAAIG
jgi:rhomboid protease GluP